MPEIVSGTRALSKSRIAVNYWMSKTGGFGFTSVLASPGEEPSGDISANVELASPIFMLSIYKTLLFGAPANISVSPYIPAIGP